jgi:hypothetical protein
LRYLSITAVAVVAAPFGEAQRTNFERRSVRHALCSPGTAGKRRCGGQDVAAGVWRLGCEGERRRERSTYPIDWERRSLL